MKTLIVYVHLIAACVAVGIMLIQDLALAKTRGQSLSKLAVEELQRAAKTISMALVALWVSGLLLVVIGYAENPQQYLLNQKLWAKFTVVGILTLNGIALHHFSFPRVVSSRGISGLGNIEKTLVVLTGVVSSVSWLFACYLGIARPWNYTVNYSFVMTVYFSLLIPACIGGCILIHALRFFPQDFFREPAHQSFPDAIRHPAHHPVQPQLARDTVQRSIAPAQKKVRPATHHPEPPLLTDAIQLPDSMRLGNSMQMAKRASKT
ncbi:hypothetical protein [Cellvibrio fontiphilus]|uniref:DUF2214 domain-containing protein n=1 Tax=Cellvibrio fontiphilus TaxID=1815559 RepID=A0ABV7FFP3_9GAMM